MRTRKVVLLLLVSLLVFGMANITQVSAKPQKVTVWIGWSQLLPVYKEVVADYKKATGVDVEVLAFPLREFERKLAVSLPSGNAPDVFVTSEYIIPQYIDSGFVMEPPKTVTKFIKSSFDPMTLKLNTFNKKVYGVPQIGIARILYWNKDLFKKAGLSNPPRNWNELIDDAKKLTVYDDKGKVVRSGICLRKFGGGSGVTEKFQIMLASAGGDILTKTANGKWRAAYNDEAGRATLKLYIDLIHKYATDSFETKQDTEAFTVGHTAMYIREVWPIPYFKTTAPNLKFGTTIIPGRVNGKSGTVYSTEAAYVPKNSKNAKTAWNFIMFFNRKKYSRMMLEDIGWPAPRTDVDFSDIYKREPAYSAALQRPKEYKLSTYPPIVASDEIWTKLGDRLEAAFRNASLVDNPEGIKKALDDAAAETNKILQDNGLY